MEEESKQNGIKLEKTCISQPYLLFPTYRVCSGNRGDVLRLTITYLNVWYPSPVRGSRTVAWAEKTMKETLILGLKMRKHIQTKVSESAKVTEHVFECLFRFNPQKHGFCPRPACTGNTWDTEDGC